MLQPFVVGHVKKLLGRTIEPNQLAPLLDCLLAYEDASEIEPVCASYITHSKAIVTFAADFLRCCFADVGFQCIDLWDMHTAMILTPARQPCKCSSAAHIILIHREELMLPINASIIRCVQLVLELFSKKTCHSSNT